MQNSLFDVAALKWACYRLLLASDQHSAASNMPTAYRLRGVTTSSAACGLRAILEYFQT